MTKENGFDLGFILKRVRGVRQIDPKMMPDIKDVSLRTFYICEFEDQNGNRVVDNVPSYVAQEKAPYPVLAYLVHLSRWSSKPIDAENFEKFQEKKEKDSSVLELELDELMSMPAAD